MVRIARMAGQGEHLHSDTDVENILRLALHESGDPSEDLRQRLERSAAELGIPPDALARAEARYLSERSTTLAREQEDRLLAEYNEQRRRSLWPIWVPYIIVNAALFLMDMLGDGQVNWAFWPMIGWGIGVLIPTLILIQPATRHDQEFQKWLRRRAKKSADPEAPPS